MASRELFINSHSLRKFNQNVWRPVVFWPSFASNYVCPFGWVTPLKLQGENVWTAIGPSDQSNIWSQIDLQHQKNSELFTDLSIKAEVQPCSLKSDRRMTRQGLLQNYAPSVHPLHIWFSISICSQPGAKKTNLWPRNAYRFLNCEWSPEAEKLKQHGVTSTFSSWTLVDHNRYPVSFFLPFNWNRWETRMFLMFLYHSSSRNWIE